jgi:hypothetical protein
LRMHDAFTISDYIHVPRGFARIWPHPGGAGGIFALIR